jgi:predicted MPP superfamily phosphohydrolase
MAATVRAAAFSCVHAPFFDKEAQRWLNQKVSGLKLDYLICLGDLLEADAASVHPGESEHSLEHEYQSAAGFLTGAREAADNDRCQFIWLLGNHDANIQKRDPRRVPKPLRSLLDWNKHNAEFAKWRQIPYLKGREGCFELGQTIFTHGFDAGAASDENEAIQFNNYCGGHGHRLVVRGHTHRPRVVTQAMRTRTIPLPLWYCNAGTMGPLKPDYMERKDTSQWGSALVVVETKMGRACQPARNWDAQVLIHKMGA